MLRYKRPTSLSAKGAEFIARQEGTVLHPYNDAAGHATIGVGHLLHKGPVTAADRYRWRNFTHAKAMELLRLDVKSANASVRTHVRAKINQRQHDALVSFAFNVGTGGFQSSDLLKTINRYPGSPLGIISPLAKTKIRAQFLRWTKAGGRSLPGLVRRRNEEARLFNKGKYT